MLGALRGLVLDEVRLVDHHAAEAEVAQPADVAVEHLVVDDHDVGEAVEVSPSPWITVAALLRRPQLGLARPVGLDHVGHHDEQRVGVGGLRREQRLRGLAQARLVGQQEGAVTRPRRRPTTRAWCVHQLEALGGVQRDGLGQRHAGRGAAPPCSKERSSGPISSQPASRGRGPGARRSGEVGGEERVGQLAGDHRLRHDAALGGGGGYGRARRSGLLRHARSRRRSASRGGALRAASETSASSASSASSEVSRTAVLARIVAMPSSRLSCSARWVSVRPAVGLDPGALLAHQQRDHLELGADRRHDRARAGRPSRPRARRGPGRG